ncbi:MAG: prenyltransferase [Chloroflexota bacterium]|nr:prenyltransferase [Chloroflexota bacterium]
MDNEVHSLLGSVLETHPSFLIATVAGDVPQFSETPYAFTRTAEMLSLAYAIPEGSAAHQALRRHNSVTFRIGTSEDVAWLEGSGRAVIVHDRAVNADLLRQISARTADESKPDPRTHRAVRIVPETVTVAIRQDGTFHVQRIAFAPGAQRWGYPGSTVNERLERFAAVTRANVVPVMAMPVSIGAALAWQRAGVFRPLPFGLTLVGAVAAHLASNVTNDIFDFRSGADERAIAMAAEGTLDTSSGALTGGLLSERQANLLAAGLWGTALLCGVGLTKTTGPAALGLAAAGFAFGTLYVAPPLAYGYIGHGLGEVGILASFGILPTLGSYYAQTGKLDWAPMIAALPPGLFTTDVLLNHHFFHWRSDKAAGKMTPVAVLGEEKAARLSRGMVFAAGVSVLIGITAKVYPKIALASLSTIPPVLEKLGEVGEGNKGVAFYGEMMDRTVKGSSRMGLYLLASLILSGIMERLRSKRRK